jgi:hypothetical protein
LYSDVDGTDQSFSTRPGGPKSVTGDCADGMIGAAVRQ